MLGPLAALCYGHGRGRMAAPADAYFDFDGTTRLKFKPAGLVPANRLPACVSAFTVPTGDESYVTTPSQRQLSSIAHHRAWLTLYDDLAAVDASRAAEAGIDRQYTHNTPLQLHGSYGVHLCVTHCTESFLGCSA